MPSLEAYVDAAKFQAMRARQKAALRLKRARWRSVGACRDCGLPCGVHINTGRRYRACLQHRCADAKRWQGRSRGGVPSA